MVLDSRFDKGKYTPFIKRECVRVLKRCCLGLLLPNDVHPCQKNEKKKITLCGQSSLDLTE